MNKRGFTLIEIMIVLAIMAAVIGIGAPRLFKTQDNIKSTARKFIVLGKEVRDRARVNNSTYRIAIKIDPNGGSFWVERANGAQTIDPNAEPDSKKEDNKEGPPPTFRPDTQIMKKPKSLPSNLRFVSLETVNMKSPITEGEAYIYFFPQGFVEASALQIQSGSGNNSSIWTIIFNPLTGQADIIEKAQNLKDVQR